MRIGRFVKTRPSFLLGCTFFLADLDWGLLVTFEARYALQKSSAWCVIGALASVRAKRAAIGHLYALIMSVGASRNALYSDYLPYRNFLHGLQGRARPWAGVAGQQLGQQPQDSSRRTAAGTTVAGQQLRGSSRDNSRGTAAGTAATGQQPGQQPQGSSWDSRRGAAAAGQQPGQAAGAAAAGQHS